MAWDASEALSAVFRTAQTHGDVFLEQGDQFMDQFLRAPEVEEIVKGQGIEDRKIAQDRLRESRLSPIHRWDRAKGQFG